MPHNMTKCLLCFSHLMFMNVKSSTTVICPPAELPEPQAVTEQT